LTKGSRTGACGGAGFENVRTSFHFRSQSGIDAKGGLILAEFGKWGKVLKKGLGSENPAKKKPERKKTKFHFRKKSGIRQRGVKFGVKGKMMTGDFMRGGNGEVRKNQVGEKKSR